MESAPNDKNYDLNFFMKISCAVVIRNDLVLIQYRRRGEHFVYEFPMGKVDGNESFEEAAVREFI